jgi:hypothetical protein
VGTEMLSARFVPMIWTLASEASIWAILILGFGLAVFFVAERVGQMTGAALWEERLQERAGLALRRSPRSRHAAREGPRNL